MKTIFKNLMLLVAYLFLTYPIKEYFGSGNIATLLLTIVIYIALYKIIFRNKKEGNTEAKIKNEAIK